MPSTAPIPKSLCHSTVSLALAEDLGRAGDITSLSVIPENAPAKASIVSREAGVLAGLDLVGLPWLAWHPGVKGGWEQFQSRFST